MRTPIGVLCVERLQPSCVSTRLYSAYPPFEILSPTGSKAVAIQTRFGRKPRLYVWIDPTSGLSAYWKQITARYKELENVKIVSERRDCDIEITVAIWQQINFKYSAPSDILRGPSIFNWNRNSSMDTLPHYLIRAVKFYGELKREANDSYISNGVRVKFFKLNHTASCPESNENMLRSDGVVNIEMSARSSDVPYGVKLINKTNLDLYVYMFFMINSDLRIRSHLMPTDSGDSPYSVDPPLRRKSSLAIGWGDGGYTPLSFKLEGGQLFDVDFLKIFLTTQPIDLSCLVEDTPLDMVARKPKLVQWVPPTSSSWSHIIIPVIQRLVP